MPSYRQLGYSFGPPLTPAVKKLIIITGAAFVLTYLPAQLFHWGAPFIWFGLTPYRVFHNFYIWQLVTYLFLHGGFFHILFNLFALWMFGADLERTWGSRQFLYYFFLTGIGAGLFNVILEPSSMIPTIGNSGAVYGILLAYGLLFPERLIYLYLLIPVKAKWFVLGMGVIEFISSLSSPGSGIAHVAHLGGMLVGFLYLRGHGLSFNWKLRYHEWRRARLRKRFEVYMRKHDEKDHRGPWVN